MKKYQVIIASIIAALGISVVFAGAAVNNLNVEIADISNQVIGGATDKLSTEAKKKYNIYSTFLSEETKDKYELAVAKSRLNELSDECDDCCTMLGTYENKLHNSMDNYKYADAYKYIGYIFNNAVDLHDIIIEHNDLLNEYPTLGEGLPEGGSWQFTIDDRFDDDYAIESLCKICYDVWFVENCEVARNRMYEDDGSYSIYDPAFSDVMCGLIEIQSAGGSTQHMTTGISEKTGQVYYKSGFSRCDASDIVDRFNSKTTFETLIDSLFTTSVMSNMIDNAYEIISAKLEEDINGSYYETLMESDDLTDLLISVYVYKSDEKDGGYKIDYIDFRDAVINSISDEFVYGMLNTDEYYGVAFGYMMYHRSGTGFNVCYFDSTPITDSDITTYDSVINSKKTSPMDSMCY